MSNVSSDTDSNHSDSINPGWTNRILDVAIVGAGMAGLTCAKCLRTAGLRTGVIEKSRGLGGRLATRRSPDGWADHGVRCLEEQGDCTRRLIEELLTTQVIHPWAKPIWLWKAKAEWEPQKSLKPSYVSGEGITAVARKWGQGLEILRGERVQAIAPQQLSSQPNGETLPNHWQLTLESLTGEVSHVTARSLVMAVPAPQAATLLQPLAQQRIFTNLWEQICQVEYDPCMTAIATYPEVFAPALSGFSWGALHFPPQSAIAWVGLEHSKLSPLSSTSAHQTKPIIVVQSSSEFAQKHLETTDLKSVGRELLEQAGLAIAPWLAQPESLQIHRWRYAFVKRPLSQKFLMEVHPLPLICCGDWCCGNSVEDALESGEAAGLALGNLLTVT